MTIGFSGPLDETSKLGECPFIELKRELAS